jgi:serine/threonine protein phosphatase PrpC
MLSQHQFNNAAGAVIDHAQQGCAKRRVQSDLCDPLGNYPEASNVKLTTYGQDVVSTLGLDEDGVLVTCLADGHSEFVAGANYSKYASYLLPGMVVERLSEISDLFRHRDNSGLKRLMHDIFKSLDDHLHNVCVYTKDHKVGGSTMTMNLKFPHPTKKWKMCSVTSNIGDSPMFKVRPGRGEVTELTHCLNGDTKKAYHLYIEECLRNGVQPKNVWLSRCNSGKPSSFKAPWITDEDGQPRAIQVFDYEVDENQKVTVTDHPDVKVFYENAPDWMQAYLQAGGTQALRGRKENIEDMQNGLFPAANFGNTVEWGVQNLSSFGDKTDRVGDMRRVLTVHTHIEVIERTQAIIIGSDGFSDVVTDQAILDSFQKVIHQPGGPSASAHLTSLYDSMMKTARETKSAPGLEHKLFPMGTDGSIKWDDVSVVVQIITIKPPKGSKNRRRKRK